MEESTVSLRQLATTSKHVRAAAADHRGKPARTVDGGSAGGTRTSPARLSAGARRGGVRPARRPDAHGGHRGFAVGLVARGRPPDLDRSLRELPGFVFIGGSSDCCATGRRFPPRSTNFERTAHVWKKSSHEPARITEATFDRRKRTQPRATGSGMADDARTKSARSQIRRRTVSSTCVRRRLIGCRAVLLRQKNRATRGKTFVAANHFKGAGLVIHFWRTFRSSRSRNSTRKLSWWAW